MSSSEVRQLAPGERETPQTIRNGKSSFNESFSRCTSGNARECVNDVGFRKALMSSLAGIEVNNLQWQHIVCILSVAGTIADFVLYIQEA